MPNKMTVVNLDTMAASEYNLPWVNIVSFNNVLHGCTTEGIQKLSGAIEAGATPSYQTGKLNLVPGIECCVHPAYMLVSSASPLTLTLRGDDSGEEEAISYSVPVLPSAQRRQRKIQLARGIKASSWSFGLSSTGGQVSEWSVSSVYVEVPSIRPPKF